MTKKDYDLIAACIGSALADNDDEPRGLYDVTNRLVLELSLENPRFDQKIFRNRIEYWRKRRMPDTTYDE